MKKIQMTTYGGPDVLKIQNSEVNQPGKGQALIRIHAAGINFIDIYHRRGTYPVNLPCTLGYEASGVVEAVGKGVKNVHWQRREATK